KRQADRMKRTEITQEYVLNSLKSVADRCMGERLDSSGANKSLELLGKHLKLFTEKVEQSGSLTLNVITGIEHAPADD
ncbi:MAG: hypothetical protein WC491_09055, partial [Candidatus Omnitrophota bacterium]